MILLKYNDIELNRKVDLASYNDYETQAKSIDWQVRTDSENQEFDLTTLKILKTYADRFILKASEYGISRYEKILNIKKYLCIICVDIRTYSEKSREGGEYFEKINE